MKKFLLLFITTFLFAFDASKIYTNILSTTNTKANIDTPIQAGMTGYVIHNNMMIAKAVSLGYGHVKLLPLKSLKNNALASPKVMPTIGDKIIFGLYNFRGLIIAPNQTIYLNTIKSHPNIKFISSDIFANYFEVKPEKKDFQKFCSDFNIGIIDFILDKEYIVDCNSFVILKQKNIKKAPYTKALFTNYSKLTTSLFSSTPKNWINYYKSLLKVSNGQ